MPRARPVESRGMALPAGAERPVGLPALAAAAAGVAQALSFGPWPAWWLQIASLAVLAGLLAGVGPRRAAVLAWTFGTAWLVAGLWWLYVSMHDFGGMPAPLAAAAVVVLGGLLSLYLAAAMTLRAALVGRDAEGVAGAAGFVGAWLLAELLRATLFTGFPWIAAGYAHADGPLAVLAPWIGVYGIGAVSAAAAWSLAHAARPAADWRWRAAPAGGLALLLALGHAVPAGFTQSTGSVTVSLLQPNVPQDLKFDPDRMGQNLRDLLLQVTSARGQVVVTPESVVPLSREDLGEAVLDALHAPFRAADRGLLLGLFVRNADGEYVNSMLGLSPDEPDYVYGKRHLLPFGEFIPPGFGWFVRLMAIPLGDQGRGTQTAPWAIAGQRLRPLVCYEDLFGEDFADAVSGPQVATVLVNASNLAWFGRHMVQEQHLQFSRLRALEFQRPLVRATNTGSTAAVDHTGAVIARLPPMVRDTLDVTVEGRTGTTPYAAWLVRWHLRPLWATAVALLALAGAVALGRRAWARRRAVA